MHSARSETLAFLAPGLLHQLGNVLFTIQGNAQVAGFTSTDGNRERAAIAAATDRGAEVLRVLRCLLGDPSAVPVPAGGLLAQLADLARVPLREAHQTLEWRPDAAAEPVLVDPVDFCVVVLEAVRGIVALLPDGVSGAIVLGLRGGKEHRAAVAVAFQPPSGALPFPLPLAELVGRLDPARLGLRTRPAVRVDGMGLEIEFAARAGSPPNGP